MKKIQKKLLWKQLICLHSIQHFIYSFSLQHSPSVFLTRSSCDYAKFHGNSASRSVNNSVHNPMRMCVVSKPCAILHTCCTCEWESHACRNVSDSSAFLFTNIQITVCYNTVVSRVNVHKRALFSRSPVANDKTESGCGSWYSL